MSSTFHPASAIRFLPAAARVATPWKNGGGITREVARDERSRAGDAFAWRVSVAEVAAEGPFSVFPGCRRLIAVIRGGGMQLHAARWQRPLRPFEPFEFEGDSAIAAILPHGPVMDLNVIFRPDEVQAALRFVQSPHQWSCGPDDCKLLINTDVRPASCMADARPLELLPLDSVAVTGAALELTSACRCALIEISSAVANRGDAQSTRCAATMFTSSSGASS